MPNDSSGGGGVIGGWPPNDPRFGAGGGGAGDPPYDPRVGAGAVGPDPNTTMASQADLKRVTDRVAALEEQGAKVPPTPQPLLNRLDTLSSRLDGLEAVVLGLQQSDTTTVPRNLQASVSKGTSNSAGISVSTVTLWWTLPARRTPNSYIVEAGSKPGAVDVLRSAIPSSPTTYTATNVAKGRYYVRLRAVYDSGESDPSNEVVVDVT